jgi:hypothetical protein
MPPLPSQGMHSNATERASALHLWRQRLLGGARRGFDGRGERGSEAA